MDLRCVFMVRCMLMYTETHSSTWKAYCFAYAGDLHEFKSNTEGVLFDSRLWTHTHTFTHTQATLSNMSRILLWKMPVTPVISCFTRTLPSDRGFWTSTSSPSSRFSSASVFALYAFNTLCLKQQMWKNIINFHLQFKIYQCVMNYRTTCASLIKTKCCGELVPMIASDPWSETWCGLLLL